MSAPSPAVRPPRSGHSLRRAQKLLALPDPEIDLALTYLLDALRDTDLAVREAAAATLASLGPPAVSAIIEAWATDDLDLRKSLIVTLGKMGPEARTAAPLLTAASRDTFLTPWAQQALAQVQPPLLAPVLEVATSPWTWSRLIDLLLVIVTHPVAAALSLVSTLISIGHWYGTLAHARGGVVPAIQGSLALLGVCLGGTVGAWAHGLSVGKIAAKTGGMCGAAVGLFLGGMAAALVEPLASALGGR